MGCKTCVLCGVKTKKHITVFSFPKNENLRKKWAVATGVSRVSSFDGVCVKHFREKDISPTLESLRLRLSRGAVPSVQLECTFRRRAVPPEDTELADGTGRDAGHQSTSAPAVRLPSYERRRRILGLVATRPLYEVDTQITARSEDVTRQKRSPLSNGAAPVPQGPPAGNESSELAQSSTNVTGAATLPSDTAAAARTKCTVLIPGQKRISATVQTGRQKRITKQRKVLASGNVVLIRGVTYRQLQRLKTQLNCESVASTIAHLAKWYLRSRAVKGGQRHLHSAGATARRRIAADTIQTRRATAAVAQTQPATDDVARPQPAVQTPVAAAGSADSSVAPCPPDYREYSFMPGGAAPASRRDMAEAELLESLDVELETADDPGAASDEETSPGDDEGAAGRHWDVRSAVVSEPQLLVLLAEAAAVCPQCRWVIPPHVARRGLAYLVTWRCSPCQKDARKPWHSTEQTLPGRAAVAAVFDTVFAAAVTLSGCSVAAVRRLMAFCNLGTLSGAAYRSVTDELVHPVIEQAYWAAIDANRTAALHASPDGLVLAGDYQEDVSDCTASCGVYTVMDHTTGRIVAQSTVPRQENGVLTSRGEEAAKSCLAEIRKAGIPVVEFISDRRDEVQKLVQKTLPRARHSFDVWRVAKDIEKEVNAYALQPKYKQLRPWVSRIKQHFWWCAKTSNGDEAIFKRRWSMFAHHVCDVHVTASGANACHHEPAPEEDAEGSGGGAEWLTSGSDAHKAIQEVVLSPSTLALCGPCAFFRHSDQLDVYHQLENTYTPKESTYSDCVARKQVAVLDMTEHLQRPFQKNEDGSVRVKGIYSTVLDSYVVRPLKTAKTFPHVRSLLAEMVELGRRQDEGV